MAWSRFELHRDLSHDVAINIAIEEDDGVTKYPFALIPSLSIYLFLHRPSATAAKVEALSPCFRFSPICCWDFGCLQARTWSPHKCEHLASPFVTSEHSVSLRFYLLNTKSVKQTLYLQVLRALSSHLLSRQVGYLVQRTRGYGVRG